MNGFISSYQLRFTLSVVTCLLGGFHFGMNFNDSQLAQIKLDSLISVQKTAWVFNNLTRDYSTPSQGEITKKLNQFETPAIQKIAKIHKNKSNNDHQKKYVKSVLASDDSLEEFKKVTEQMHQNLLTGMEKNNPEKEEVTILASSASINMPLMLEHDLKKLLVKSSGDQLLAQVDFGSIPGMNTQIMDTQIGEVSTDSSIVSEDAEVQTSTVEKLEIGKNLENALLDQHVENQNTIKEEVKSEQIAAMKEHEKEVEVTEDAFASVTETNSTGCSDIQKVKLIKPVDAINGEISQICPLRKKWISKDKNGNGWVKMDIEGHFSTIIHYPQLNSNHVLLLDQNSVALLAIKTGVHISSEAGMLMGTVPTNHKIQFAGRGEDVQYIDINAKKFFFVLNAEPGAGVIEVVSEQNPTESVTVFVPVMKETISYVDLGTPKTSDLNVKIKKEGSKQEEISGLNVSLSTQTQIQTNTDHQGRAILKGVKYIHGYPLHLDVSSKSSGIKSYQYRYELGTTDKDGAYILKQFQEKNIHHWLKQVNTRIHHQSGMIIGSFNRKGFKDHFFAKVTHFGDDDHFKPKTMSILWDEKLSEQEPLEGDHPRSLTVQLTEGLAQYNIVNDSNKIVKSSLIPVSPRVINVISE